MVINNCLKMFYKFLRLGNFNMNNTIKGENFSPVCTGVFWINSVSWMWPP